jgi:hypothetical protein
MLNHYFKNLLTLEKYQTGPAGPYLDQLIGWFEERGYRRCCIRRHIRGADHFIRWARRSGLTDQQLNTNALEAFGNPLQEHCLLTYASGN